MGGHLLVSVLPSIALTDGQGDGLPPPPFQHIWVYRLRDSSGVCCGGYTAVHTVLQPDSRAEILASDTPLASTRNPKELERDEVDILVGTLPLR